MAVPVRRRTRARELALQFLYTLEMRRDEALEELDSFLDHHTRRDPDKRGAAEVGAYARTLILGVHEHVEELNQWITAIARNWRLERMAHIDRNILRMSVFELLYNPEVPFKVAINEAIDVAKRFSTAQSGSFVNGILDRARTLIEERRTADQPVPPPPAPGDLKPQEPDAPREVPQGPVPRPRPRSGRPLPPRPSSQPTTE